MNQVEQRPPCDGYDGRVDTEGVSLAARLLKWADALALQLHHEVDVAGHAGLGVVFIAMEPLTRYEIPTFSRRETMSTKTSSCSSILRCFLWRPRAALGLAVWARGFAPRACRARRPLVSGFRRAIGRRARQGHGGLAPRSPLPNLVHDLVDLFQRGSFARRCPGHHVREVARDPAFEVNPVARGPDDEAVRGLALLCKFPGAERVWGPA